jgi:hypothetical protein
MEKASSSEINELEQISRMLASVKSTDTGEQHKAKLSVVTDLLLARLEDILKK